MLGIVAAIISKIISASFISMVSPKGWFFPSTFTNLKTTWRKNYLLSYIYLFIPLFIYIVTDWWLFEFKSSVVLTFPVWAIKSSFSWAPVWSFIKTMPPHPDFLSVFLLFGTIWCFCVTLCLWCPSPGMNHFSKKLGYLLFEYSV